ncbi:MAG: hypothetical protein SOS24_01720, partial [Clostridia bacterium]|nr:hypothetical protein [Clostridia bacterium]
EKKPVITFASQKPHSVRPPFLAVSADCSFEECRRMLILQAPIKGKMRSLFFTLILHSAALRLYLLML